MSTTIEKITAADQAVLDFALTNNRKVLSRFLNTFGHVPDDKLGWKPAETAKSAWDLAAHIVFGYFLIADTLGMPYADNASERIAHNQLSSEVDPARRQELQELVRTMGEANLTYMETFTSERLNGVIDTFFGVPLPVRALLLVPGRHLDSHAAQIDYIQTMWGDLENHM